MDVERWSAGFVISQVDHNVAHAARARGRCVLSPSQASPMGGADGRRIQLAARGQRTWLTQLAHTYWSVAYHVSEA